MADTYHNDGAMMRDQRRRYSFGKLIDELAPKTEFDLVFEIGCAGTAGHKIRSRLKGWALKYMWGKKSTGWRLCIPSTEINKIREEGLWE